MKWEDYSKKHLDHIKIIFYDAQLSLRFKKHTNAYKLCEIILSKVNDTSKGSYYQTLFNVYVWCNKYIDEVPDISIYNNLLLLHKQVIKQIKKMNQRLKLVV